MPRPRSAPDFHLLSKVSTLYYLRDQTQQEIAERLHISRPKVSRLLQEARELGVVHISVTPPTGLHIELEERLEEQFGLEEVEVVELDSGQSAEAGRHQIGAAAAAHLARTIQPGETIGIAWGTTLDAMVRAMIPLPCDRVRVVQMLGGIGPPDSASYAAALVRRLAQQLGAAPVLLPAPGIIATPAVRDALRGDPHVEAALRHLDGLDAAYIGIGSLDTNPVLNDGHSIPPGTRAELAAAGAVGDLALRFFTAQGCFAQTSLDERILGITVDQLRATKRVVAVAGGPEKHDAIRSALRTKVLDVLITDRRTAETLANGRE